MYVWVKIIIEVLDLFRLVNIMAVAVDMIREVMGGMVFERKTELLIDLCFFIRFSKMCFFFLKLCLSCTIC